MTSTLSTLLTTESPSSSFRYEDCFVLPDPSFENVHERKGVNLATIAINGFFAPFAVVSNFFIVLVIVRNVSLQTPSNILLGCLAVCDLLVGLVVQPCYISFRIMETFNNFVPCSLRIVYSESFWICYGVSFMTLSAISLERFIALHVHLRYKELVTSRRIVKVVLAIWIVDITLTSLEWLPQQKYFRYVQVALWLACLLLTCLAHVRIFQILRRHQLQISAAERQPTPVYNYQRQIKLAISVAYMVGIYCAFNIPVMVVQLYIYSKGRLASYNITSWTETVAFLNSSINPIVCCWKNKDIRDAVLRIVVKRPCAEHLEEDGNRRVSGASNLHSRNGVRSSLELNVDFWVNKNRVSSMTPVVARSL